MADSDEPQWAWAVIDRVITPNPTGFTETHTLAIASEADPERGDYVTEPAIIMRFAGTIHPGYLMREWGWEQMGPWGVVDTTVLHPVETRLLGTIPPYRGAIRVRRRGAGTDADAVAPVPYGEDLLSMFDDDQDPGASGQSGPIPGPGTVIAAARLLVTSECVGGPDCEDAWQRHQAGEELTEADQVRSLAFEARSVVDAFDDWFVSQVREYGWPRAGIDDSGVRLCTAVQAAAHPDAGFRLECLLAARHLASSGDIDPDHVLILEAATTDQLADVEQVHAMITCWISDQNAGRRQNRLRSGFAPQHLASLRNLTIAGFKLLAATASPRCATGSRTSPAHCRSQSSALPLSKRLFNGDDVAPEAPHPQRQRLRQVSRTARESPP